MWCTWSVTPVSSGPATIAIVGLKTPLRSDKCYVLGTL